MIVRISGEDQYLLADEYSEELKQLESAVVSVVDAGRAERLRRPLRGAARLRAHPRHDHRRSGDRELPADTAARGPQLRGGPQGVHGRWPHP